MTIVGRPPRRRPCAPDCANTCAAARPSFSAVSAVTGSMLATPRTPSVPKILRACSADETEDGEDIEHPSVRNETVQVKVKKQRALPTNGANGNEWTSPHSFPFVQFVGQKSFFRGP